MADRLREPPRIPYGTLWESRYKSSPIETDAYLLACCRYVELNPVRARITRDPGAYTWSSYRRHAGTKNEFPWVDTDPCYLALGSSDRERTLRYMDFVREVEAIIGRRIENRKLGRLRREGGNKSVPFPSPLFRKAD